MKLVFSLSKAGMKLLYSVILQKKGSARNTASLRPWFGKIKIHGSMAAFF